MVYKQGIRGITFDDVLLTPEYSTIESRLSKDIDLSTNITKKIRIKLPIISSPMYGVTDEKFAYEINKLGCASIIYRFQKIEDQYTLHNIRDVICAVGLDDLTRGEYLYEKGVRTFCIDVASGHNKYVGDEIKRYKDKFPDVEIIAGNVVTADGARYLMECGVDAIRCGVGSGSICQSRIATGCGTPQLTAIQESYFGVEGKIPIFADGGIRYSSDVVKALAFGASAVMIGRLFTTYSTCGGIPEKIGNRIYKTYYGHASKEFQNIMNGGMKIGTAPEGVTTTVARSESDPTTLKEFIDEFSGGIRSAMSYLNCRNIEDLRDVEYMEISEASVREGLPR